MTDNTTEEDHAFARALFARHRDDGKQTVIEEPTPEQPTEAQPSFTSRLFNR